MKKIRLFILLLITLGLAGTLSLSALAETPDISPNPYPIPKAPPLPEEVPFLDFSSPPQEEIFLPPPKKEIPSFTEAGITVTGGIEGEDFTYEDNTFTVLSSTPLTFSGASEKASIVVEQPITAWICLADYTAASWSFSEESANSHTPLSLQNGRTIVYTEGTAILSGTFSPAIEVGEKAQLILAEDSQLVCTGWEACAAVGGGKEQTVGTIVLDGATLTATGGAQGAGLGTGFQGRGGSFYLKGNSILTTTGGEGAAGLGSGFSGEGSSIVIEDSSKITAKGGNHAAAIGGGESSKDTLITIRGGNITANGGAMGAGIGTGYQGSCHITITGGTVHSVGGSAGAGIGGGLFSDNCMIVIQNGDIHAQGGSSSAGIGSGLGGRKNHVVIYGGDIQAYGSDEGAGIGGGNNSGNGGWNGSVSIHGGRIRAYPSQNFHAGAAIGSAGGQVLTDKETGVRSLPENNGTVVITGGEIYAYGRDPTASEDTYHGHGAGIGSGAYNESGGTILISGGTIFSFGGSYGAGIGSGSRNSSGGLIQISGGDIFADSHMLGAGIGGGVKSSAGNILISGGTTKAYGAGNSAAIGSSQGSLSSDFSGNNITITGGDITAKAATKSAEGKPLTSGGAGIGSGGASDEGPFTITIWGGTIYAAGGLGSAGIGAGWLMDAGDISVHGGEIYALGQGDASGIGAGNGRCGNIYIDGGTIYAKGQGSKDNAGIGGRKSGGLIVVEGGYIKAESDIDVAFAPDGFRNNKPVGKITDSYGRRLRPFTLPEPPKDIVAFYFDPPYSVSGTGLLPRKKLSPMTTPEGYFFYLPFKKNYRFLGDNSPEIIEKEDSYMSFYIATKDKDTLEYRQVEFEERFDVVRPIEIFYVLSFLALIAILAGLFLANKWAADTQQPKEDTKPKSTTYNTD